MELRVSDHCEVVVFLQRRIVKVKDDLGSAMANYRCTGLVRYRQSLDAAKAVVREAEHDLESHLETCSTCSGQLNNEMSAQASQRRSEER
jgi:hypothetical protein